MPSGKIFPISIETSLPNCGNFARKASPICRTISPLFGAGVCSRGSGKQHQFQFHMLTIDLACTQSPNIRIVVPPTSATDNAADHKFSLQSVQCLPVVCTNWLCKTIAQVHSACKFSYPEMYFTT